MARKISGKEQAKINKLKNAPMYEPSSFGHKNGGVGQYSTKTVDIAKKQGVLKNTDIYGLAKNSKDEATLKRIQLQRNNDLAKSKGRAKLIESNAKRRKKAAAVNNKKTLPK